MKFNIITVIPVYNGEKFIRQTLESVAKQTQRPDRVIVLDNCSTDGTEKVVRSFQQIQCEFIRNPTNLGLFGNCNRALEFAPETKYLHLLCADDLVEPEFYQRLTAELQSCDGLGLAYSLDERIDEQDRHLSISGKVTGSAEEISTDVFLSRKAEIANQAFSGSLMKTNYQKPPCQFRLDMPILADVAWWAAWGKHCRKIIQVNLPLCKYRWHGDNTTNVVMPGMQALILDEWRVMQLNEQLRNGNSGAIRRFKLKGLFAVRTGIKAKRIRQQNNFDYSQNIVREGKKISGPLAWYMGQAVVEARDLLIYTLMRRPRHPKNVYS
ncbi:MAG TPA: glycosyltransferase family A protein [Verrucomicrobiae bacterium]|nr:glycosyltransferase family A protein [Verrucomicrobiae bacterium]